ncbi:MAG: tetratricopeptide repeat protein [bacterium]|nr:tetratricopeptide repeat protein [bacterium]
MLSPFYKWLLVMGMWLTIGRIMAQEAVADTITPQEVLYSKASKLIDSAKYKEGVVLLKKAIKLRPDYWEAFNKMAFAKIKLKDYKGAEKDLLKAEEIAPLNYETIKLKGINFFLSGNYKEAKTMLDTALYVLTEEKIEDAELYYYRAQLMFLGKSYKSALENCEVALDYRPNYPEVQLLKGQIRFAQKEYNHAVRELSTAIDKMPETNREYLAYELRAKSKFELGDYKGAVSDWNVYIEGIPGEEQSLISRAAAKINTGENTSAIIDLDDAIKLNGKNPVSYCYRGVAKGGNKQYVEALKDLDFSIKLKFDYAAAYVNRAAIKMASKDKRGACADLEKADGLGDELAIKLIEQYCRDSRN